LFLSQFNLEEKVAFLKLAHIVASIDGELGSNEKKILEQYAQEMQLQDILKELNESIEMPNGGASLGSALEILMGNTQKETSTTNILDNVAELVSVFKSNTARRVLLLEIMAIVYANNEYHPEQQEIITFILEAYVLSPHLVTVYTEWAKSILSLYRQGEALINL